MPDWGEFVLAEFTQTFERGDVTYSFRLMQQVERRLGHRPRDGAIDMAFDAFYVYQSFYEAGGFAAVPLAEKGGYKTCPFSPDPTAVPGRTDAVQVHVHRPHDHPRHDERGKRWPLRFRVRTADTCPVNHANWPKGGCTAMMPTCAGARIRYQLDRESAQFKAVYKQRTTDERVNSRPLELGIERPKLRRQSAITNQNTLIYVLINLRALQRIRIRKEHLAQQRQPPG